MTEQKINGDRQTKGKYLTPFQRDLLQKSLRQEPSEKYRQRIKIMLLADEGKTQSEICQSVNCAAATVRHWMSVARMGNAHQWKDQPVGRPKKIGEEFRERLKELIGQNPQDYGYAFRRWTGNWLSRHLAKEFGVEVHERHIIRLLKEMGLSTRFQPSSPENPLDDSAKKHRISIQDL